MNVDSDDAVKHFASYSCTFMKHPLMIIVWRIPPVCLHWKCQAVKRTCDSCALSLG